MSVFKCKMCGGDLQIEAGATVAECEYCVTKQTLPRLNDERIANLYDRANHLRRNNDFDKAMSIYEKILIEDSTDAEAYWSLVLCRFGIEYVEDPQSHRRVPTVHRAQLTSIFDDENYKIALEKADIGQRVIYQEEAKQINEIQKGILAISDREEPFDVFICYKESDSYGGRTPDSVLAQELYYELTEAGFKVFFSRITLEDKLGSAYEPYIFAALNSAKVMVVVGTKPEHFNAVWVKNEWSRYLSLIKQGAKKTLVPAYKDMSPYDLPTEFSHLQAQDMSKLGFMQDLVRGIRKLIPREDPKKAAPEGTASSIAASGSAFMQDLVRGVKNIFAGEEKKQSYTPSTVVSGNSNAQALLRRAFMFIEDGQFQTANEYAERVLDVEPENADAYLCKLMVDLQIKSRAELGKRVNSFLHNPNYKRMMSYGDEALKAEMGAYVENYCEKIYQKAKQLMASNTPSQYTSAEQLLGRIPNYKDSFSLAKVCRLERIYTLANVDLHNKNYVDALAKYKSISGWRDSEKRAKAVENKMSANKEKIKKIIMIGAAATVALTVLCVAAVTLFIFGGVGFFALV